MGAYRQEYIGPYLVVNHKEIDSFDNIKICGNISCNRFQKETNSKFCPQCGQEVVNKKITAKKIFTVFSFINKNYEHWIDRLSFVHDGGVSMFKDKQICLPNIYANRPFVLKIDGDSSGVYQLPTEQQKEVDIKWFQETYKDMIEKILEEFGDENTKIEYGLVVNYA